MNLFQKYEIERKPFTSGKKWICLHPENIGMIPDTLNEIIEIDRIDNIINVIFYDVMSGKYKGGKYNMNKIDFIKVYEPYIGEVPIQEEEMTND